VFAQVEKIVTTAAQDYRESELDICRRNYSDHKGYTNGEWLPERINTMLAGLNKQIALKDKDSGGITQ